MKLADLSTGPDWVVYVGFIIFAVLSIVLISGHGSWLISGYNTASKEEKAKYNEKKLCRTMGIGMSVIAAFCRVQRTPMRFRADAVQSTTDALKQCIFSYSRGFITTV